MDPIEETLQNTTTRKRGRPRRVLFEEIRAPETPNNVDNTIPHHEARELSPPARRPPRARNLPARHEHRGRIPPRNELAADQLFNLL